MTLWLIIVLVAFLAISDVAQDARLRWLRDRVDRIERERLRACRPDETPGSVALTNISDGRFAEPWLSMAATRCGAISPVDVDRACAFLRHGSESRHSWEPVSTPFPPRIDDFND